VRTHAADGLTKRLRIQFIWLLSVLSCRRAVLLARKNSFKIESTRTLSAADRVSDPFIRYSKESAFFHSQILILAKHHLKFILFL